MEYNPEIFKAYDIRGLVGKDFDLEFCERLGRAFVVHTKAKTVVLGRDMRGSSPEYLAAVAKGVMKQGADVIDIGMVTTPMFYFAVRDYELHDGGIMVTASHNPAAYNGFKLVDGTALSFGRDGGGSEIKELVERNHFPEAKEGTLIETSILADYLDKITSLVDIDAIKGLKVVVDAANGVGIAVLPELFKRLPGALVIPLYWEPDGSFPNHEANPAKEDTLTDLKKRVVAEKADLGIALDGDCDRVMFIDEKGQSVKSLETLVILARELLKTHPGAPIAADIHYSTVTKEEIEKLGSKFVLVPVGGALAKPVIRREHVLLSAELSAHFYYGQFAACESTAYTMLLMMGILCREQKTLSDLVNPLRRTFDIGEVNFEVSDKQGVFDRALAAFRGTAASISTFDGIRLDFADRSWFNLRASNTEPVIRLTVEAQTKERLDELKGDLVALIRPS
jgi:phosphomannomutase